MPLKSPVLRLFIATLLCLSGAAALGEAQAADGEKIRDISPDRQFALCIEYDVELNKEYSESGKEDPDKVFSQATKGVDLVALPSKKSVTNLIDRLGDEDRVLTLIWSADSKWFALYSGTHRIGVTSIYHRSGDGFVLAGDTDTDHLSVDAEKGLKGAEVKNEYVRPIRWTSPGILVLEQTSIFRGVIDSVTFQLTVGVDPKSGKFRILSKKKVGSQKTIDN